MIMFYSVNRCIQIAYITLILVHARYVFVYTKTLATAELSFYHSIFRVEKSYKRFNEGDFFRKCESSFDKRTGYDRAPEQTFDYLNTMKNGSPKEIFQKKEWAERVNHERLEKMKAEWSRDLQEPHQEQGREESQQQGNSISQVPEINQAPQRKKQQEEELDQPRKRSRGFGMGM